MNPFDKWQERAVREITSPAHYVSKAHEFEAVIVRLAVNENKIKHYVAVAVIAPFAGERTIEIPAWQRCVGPNLHAHFIYIRVSSAKGRRPTASASS
jgi:hypothetical protein